MRNTYPNLSPPQTKKILQLKTFIRVNGKYLSQKVNTGNFTSAFKSGCLNENLLQKGRVTIS